MKSYTSLLTLLCCSLLIAQAHQSHAIGFGWLSQCCSQVVTHTTTSRVALLGSAVLATAGLIGVYSRYCAAKRAQPNTTLRSFVSGMLCWPCKNSKKTASPTSYKLAPIDYTWSLLPGEEHTLSKQSAPVVASIQWGVIGVNKGKSYTSYSQEATRCSDCILTPSSSQPWDWKKDGTHHKPGVQIEAVKNFIDDVDVVVLTRGMQGELQIPQATINYVEKTRGKTCYHGQTIEMVEKYNELVTQGKRVGGLFHTTC